MENSPGMEQPQEAASAVEPMIGCTHYKRKSKFVTPCCDKIYTCRFCHDDEENHSVNRKEITELVCALCKTRQVVRAECQQCATTFGNYTCLECNLFDDTDKGQFHCAGCGICRVGGANNYFHCEKCNLCLPIQRQNDHKCVENVSRANCPVCLEDIHTSRIPSHVPHCGHLLHQTCYNDLIRSGHYACPICQISLEDMSRTWAYLDNEIANTPMPADYRNEKVDILCKDCHTKSTVPFHVVGLKCTSCGSYNTCGTNRLNGDNSSDNVPADDNTNNDVIDEIGLYGDDSEENDFVTESSDDELD